MDSENFTELTKEIRLDRNTTAFVTKDENGDWFKIEKIEVYILNDWRDCTFLLENMNEIFIKQIERIIL